ncbi:hypothetical protein B0H10DRAFT_1953195 [Mycena sp. CBHHK59/15]|nr:hypothetical protein B0H10DRAFT_1953195 [Mycena sp. CBHHK59/15]
MALRCIREVVARAAFVGQDCGGWMTVDAWPPAYPSAISPRAMHRCAPTASLLSSSSTPSPRGTPSPHLGLDVLTLTDTSPRRPAAGESEPYRTRDRVWKAGRNGGSWKTGCSGGGEQRLGCGQWGTQVDIEEERDGVGRPPVAQWVLVLQQISGGWRRRTRFPTSSDAVWYYASRPLGWGPIQYQLGGGLVSCLIGAAQPAGASFHEGRPENFARCGALFSVRAHQGPWRRASLGYRRSSGGAHTAIVHGGGGARERLKRGRGWLCGKTLSISSETGWGTRIRRISRSSESSVDGGEEAGSDFDGMRVPARSSFRRTHDHVRPIPPLSSDTRPWRIRLPLLPDPVVRVCEAWRRTGLQRDIGGEKVVGGRGGGSTHTTAGSRPLLKEKRDKVWRRHASGGPPQRDQRGETRASSSHAHPFALFSPSFARCDPPAYVSGLVLRRGERSWTQGPCVRDSTRELLLTFATTEGGGCVFLTLPSQEGADQYPCGAGAAGSIHLSTPPPLPVPLPCLLATASLSLWWWDEWRCRFISFFGVWR